jgi:hypothetical protein
MIPSRQYFCFIIGMVSLGITVLCCGKSKLSPAPATSSQDGLPVHWDGKADYEAEGWRFETP